MTDQLATAAATAERALLGACLISEHAWRATEGTVDASDFIVPAHADLWAALTEADTHGERLDVVTVSRLAPNVPPALLAALMADTPAASNASRYARQVADLAVRRRLVHVGSEIIASAQADEAEAAHDRARELIAAVEFRSGKPVPDVDADSFVAGIDMRHDWLVPDFLERGDRMLVTATEGAGKSTWLTQLAMQIAAGVHPWTLRQMPARNVAIIDLENGPRLVGRRLDMLKRCVRTPWDPQRLRVRVKPEGLNLTKPADRRWLIERCHANQTELLVIGPAYRMTAGASAKGDIGGEDQTREATAALDDVRARCGVTLLMETHAPHGSGITGRDLRPFGSSVWLRWPEFGIGLRQEDRDDWRTYAVDHWRNPRDQRVWPLRLRKAAGTWPWTPEMPRTYLEDVA